MPIVKSRFFATLRMTRSLDGGSAMRWQSKRGPSLLRRDKSSARGKACAPLSLPSSGKRDDNGNRSGKMTARAKAPTLRRDGEEWGIWQDKYQGNGKWSGGGRPLQAQKLRAAILVARDRRVSHLWCSGFSYCCFPGP